MSTLNKTELIAALASMTAERDAALATVEVARTHYRTLQNKVRDYMVAETAPITTEGKYPLVDKLGRHYSQKGNVKTFAPLAS